MLGDLPAATLGACYAHEHIIIDGPFVNAHFPELHLPSVDNAVAELGEIRRAGGGAVVDAMPCDAGRDVGRLAEISRRSGVHVVAPTGLHLPKYYPRDHWRYRLGAEGLARLFVDEIERGIDGTPHRAGVIKAASAAAALDDADRPLFEAAAEAHRRTGAPIMTHCESGRGLEQIAFLRDHGVDLAHVVLSHTDRHPDRGYHRALLATGVRLEYDRIFRGPLDPSNPTARLAAELLPEFPDQILFGTDAARPVYWRSYGGGPGLAFLLTTFAGWLRDAGLPDDALHRAFVANPAAAFSFARPS